MKRLIALCAAAAFGLTACGGGTADSTQPAGSAPPTHAPEIGGGDPLDNGADGTVITGMGPGISVAELLTATIDGPFLVNGYVFVGTDGGVVISDAMAESHPPQPAGAQVRVDGADLTQLPLVDGDSEIPISSWTEGPVQLVGDLVDGVLVGNSTASA